MRIASSGVALKDIRTTTAWRTRGGPERRAASDAPRPAWHGAYRPRRAVATLPGALSGADHPAMGAGIHQLAQLLR